MLVNGRSQHNDKDDDQIDESGVEDNDSSALWIRSTEIDIGVIHSYCYFISNSRSISEDIIQEIIHFIPKSLNPSPFGLYESLPMNDRRIIDLAIKYVDDKRNVIDVCILKEPDLTLMQNIEITMKNITDWICSQRWVRQIKADKLIIDKYCKYHLRLGSQKSGHLSMQSANQIIQIIIEFTPLSMNRVCFGVYRFLYPLEKSYVDRAIWYDRMDGIDACIFKNPSLTREQNIKLCCKLLAPMAAEFSSKYGVMVMVPPGNYCRE